MAFDSYWSAPNSDGTDENVVYRFGSVGQVHVQNKKTHIIEFVSYWFAWSFICSFKIECFCVPKYLPRLAMICFKVHLLTSPF